MNVYLIDTEPYNKFMRDDDENKIENCEDDYQTASSGNDVECAGQLWKYHLICSKCRVLAGLNNKSHIIATLLDVSNHFISGDIIGIIIQYINQKREGTRVRNEKNRDKSARPWSNVDQTGLFAIFGIFLLSGWFKTRKMVPKICGILTEHTVRPFM